LNSVCISGHYVPAYHRKAALKAFFRWLDKLYHCFQ